MLKKKEWHIVGFLGQFEQIKPEDPLHNILRNEVINGNLEGIKILCQYANGATINSALSLAILRNLKDVIDCFCKMRLPAEVYSGDNSAFKLAIEQKNWHLLEILCRNQPKPKKINEVLMLAIKDSQISLVRSLCQMDTPNKPTNLNSALIEAYRVRAKDILNFLINLPVANQPSSSAIDKLIDTHLKFSENPTDWNLYRTFYNMAGQNQPSPKSIGKILVQAAKTGQAEDVYALCNEINNKPEINALGDALKAAITNKSTESKKIVSLLCQLKDPFQPSPDSVDSALKMAVNAKDWDLASILYNMKGKNKPRSEAIGEALQQAVFQGKSEAIVKSLWRMEGLDNQPTTTSVNSVLFSIYLLISNNSALAYTFIKLFCPAEPNLDYKNYPNAEGIDELLRMCLEAYPIDWSVVLYLLRIEKLYTPSQKYLFRLKNITFNSKNPTQCVVNQICEKTIKSMKERESQEAEQRAQQERERVQREAEQRAQQEAEQRAQQEAEQRAQQEAEQRAQQEAEQRAQQEAEQRAQQEAEQRAQQEAEQRAQQEAEQRAQQEAEQRAQQEAEQRAQQVAEQRAQQEAEQRAQQEAEQRAQQEAEQRAQQECEQQKFKKLEEQKQSPLETCSTDLTSSTVHSEVREGSSASLNPVDKPQDPVKGQRTSVQSQTDLQPEKLQDLQKQKKLDAIDNPSQSVQRPVALPQNTKALNEIKPREKKLSNFENKYSAQPKKKNKPVITTYSSNMNTSVLGNNSHQQQQIGTAIPSLNGSPSNFVGEENQQQRQIEKDQNKIQNLNETLTTLLEKESQQQQIKKDQNEIQDLNRAQSTHQQEENQQQGNERNQNEIQNLNREDNNQEKEKTLQNESRDKESQKNTGSVDNCSITPIQPTGRSLPAAAASLDPAHKTQNSGSSNSKSNNLKMYVLSGFITILGIAAVALAFTVLNAATGGLFGVILASVGMTTILGGMGLSAYTFFKKPQPTLNTKALENNLQTQSQLQLI